MTEEDTRKKQQYLKTEILDAGYNTEAFLEYMNSQKGRVAVE